MTPRCVVLVVALALALFVHVAVAQEWERGAIPPAPPGGYFIEPNWCPGLNAGTGTIGTMHPAWHQKFMSNGKDFVEFHRELLAQSDDARLYGFANTSGAYLSTAVAIEVTALPGSLLKFEHVDLNTYDRPPLHAIDAAHPAPGVPTSWPVRPANLRLRDGTFHNVYTTADLVGAALNAQYHGNGHMSIAGHDRTSAASFFQGDMGNTTDAPLDSAFFQWHKRVDDVYADWAVGQYQLQDNSGLPIYFSVGDTAVGAAGSVLNERRQSNVYQGALPIGASQYGAIPRIASDVYVANNNSKNLLYRYGVRQYDRNTTQNAWDLDAFTILNPPGNAWYFSVTPASLGVAGTAVRAEAVRGGDIFESAGTGTNTLFRAEALLGEAAANTDNLDALEVDEERRITGTNDSASPDAYDRSKQWFSLRSGTMFGVKASGGAAVAPNDILQFNDNGDLVIAVAGATLGLGAADDLDALVIVDTAPLNVLNASDRIYYSLAAGSPALGANSPADIFCHTVAGTPCGSLGGRLEKTAANLGLLSTDDLDALDIKEVATDTGACCHSNGTCTQVAQTSCVAPGDLFSGLQTACGAAACPTAPGACCQPNGTCTSSSDSACLLAGGSFKGAGVTCTTGLCPAAPPNDDCANAYPIPYNYINYSELPATYTNNTYASYAITDPLYSCADMNVFFPMSGSGTLWYYYDVPAGPGRYRPIGFDTTATYNSYGSGGYAYDTRVAVYYSPSGTCNGLIERACSDNSYTQVHPPTPASGGYANAKYAVPTAGRYYIQLATVGDVNRGQIRVQVYEPSTVTTPTLSTWGTVLLLLIMGGVGVLAVRRMKPRATA